MDVTDEKNVKEVSKNIYRKFNNVDILINNAAIDHKVNTVVNLILMDVSKTQTSIN